MNKEILAKLITMLKQFQFFFALSKSLNFQYYYSKGFYMFFLLYELLRLIIFTMVLVSKYMKNIHNSHHRGKNCKHLISKIINQTFLEKKPSRSSNSLNSKFGDDSLE